MISVPCGHGKTTKLPAAAARKLNIVLVVEPRITIAKSLGKYLGAASFSGDDEVELKRGVNFITHGKALNAAIADKKWLDDVDLIVLDECHDLSGIMQSLRTWCREVYKGRVMEMTGSPNSKAFLDSTLGVGKFSVMVEKRPPLTASRLPGFSVEEMAKMAVAESNHGRSVMLQVPTVAFGRKVKTRLASQGVEAEQLNAATSKEKGGLSWFTGWLASKSGRVLTCTDVVSYGVTLPVDTVIIQGTVNRMATSYGEVSRARQTPMGYADLVQWVGRVGRIKEGKAVVPDMGPMHLAAMPSGETWIKYGYDYLLGMEESIPVSTKDMLSKHGMEAVRAALKLPISFPASLGYVTVHGEVKGQCEAAVQAAAASHMANTPGTSSYKQYKVDSHVYRGTVEGCDPLVNPDWVREVLGDQIQTGIFESLMLSAIVPVFMYVLGQLGPGLVSGPRPLGDTSVAVSRAPQLQGISCETPFVLSRSNKEMDHRDILDEAVRTSLGSLVPEAVVEKLKEWVRKLAKELGFTTAVDGPVQVNFPFGSATEGKATAYYLHSVGMAGEFSLHPDMEGKFLFDAMDTAKVTGVGLTDEGMATIDGIKTSILPAVSGVMAGLAGLLAYISYTWARHGSHRDGSLGQSVHELLAPLPTRQDRTSASRGPLGRYLVTTNVFPEVCEVAYEGFKGAARAFKEKIGEGCVTAAETLAGRESFEIPVSVCGFILRPRVRIASVLLSEERSSDTEREDARQIATGALVLAGSGLTGVVLGLTPLGALVAPAAALATVFGTAGQGAAASVLLGCVLTRLVQGVWEVLKVETMWTSPLKRLSTVPVLGPTRYKQASLSSDSFKTASEARSFARGMISSKDQQAGDELSIPVAVLGAAATSSDIRVGIEMVDDDKSSIEPIIVEDEGGHWSAGVVTEGDSTVDRGSQEADADQGMLRILFASGVRRLLPRTLYACALLGGGYPIMAGAMAVSLVPYVATRSMYGLKKTRGFDYLNSKHHLGYSDRDPLAEGDDVKISSQGVISFLCYSKR